MRTIGGNYEKITAELIKNSKQSGEVSPNAVYQKANKSSRKILHKIISGLLLPHSTIENFIELQKLHALSREGNSCLILMEHYSNFDLPNLYYLLETQYPGGQEIGDSIIAMAGMKLNQESDLVRAFTEAYSRIVIYPSRSLAPLMGSAKYREEKAKSVKINMAALHEIVRQKHDKKIILLFPSGTRYRPGVQDTKRGLPEMDSYLKGFDYFLPIGIAGNTLRINSKGSMSDDFTHTDCVVFCAGNVTASRQWRNDARSCAKDDEDIKQHTANQVMNLLHDMHTQAENTRQKLLNHTHIQ